MTRKFVIHRAKSSETLIKSGSGKIIGVVRIESEEGVKVTAEMFKKRSKDRVDLVRAGKYPYGMRVWYYTTAPDTFYISSGPGSKNYINLNEVFLAYMIKKLTPILKQKGIL